ncbi:MAG: tetratricopeptide repeat protein [Verrucomicrobia bacterium]|nr:tetratricopeptide repeat protein [Verrucomicrobiota bacterium]
MKPANPRLPEDGPSTAPRYGRAIANARPLGGVPGVILARRLRANTGRMNSWHSWSPNGRWLVFASKAFGPYTQLFLTHIDENGESSPAVSLDWLTAPDRAANIPEFVNLSPDAIEEIQARFLNDDSLARAGFVAEQTGDAAAAIERYQHALELNPDNPHAHERLACLLAERQGDVAGSLRHGRLAVQFAPDNGQARYYYGQALLLSGDADAAIEQFQQALRLLPTTVVTDSGFSSAAVRTALGLAWARAGHPERGVTELTEATRLNPTNAMIRFSAATVRAHAGQIEEPLAEFRRAVQLDPGLERQFQSEEIVAGNCAREGQMARALDLARRAWTKATVAGMTADADRLRERVAAYEASARR